MKLMAIDGNSLVNRAFYAVRLLTNRQGLYTNAVYGFVNILLKLLEEEQPDQVCVCFDMRAKTFRHLKYEGYKAQRKGMPDELAQQMPIIKEVLDKMGIARMELEGFEADDLLGTLARLCREKGEDCLIVTGDRDSLQFIAQGATVKLVTTKMGQTIYKDYDEQAFRESYQGLSPDKIVDLKALMGDASDNIPGVPGIGEKTAMSLLTRFGSLDGVYAHLEDPSLTPSQKKKLQAGQDRARLSFELALGVVDAPITATLPSLSRGEMDKPGLYQLFSMLEFSALTKRLGLEGEGESRQTPQAQEISTDYRLAQPEELPELLQAFSGKDTPCRLDPGFHALALEQEGEVLLLTREHLGEEVFMGFLRDFFQGTGGKVLCDAKPTWKALLEGGIHPQGLKGDTALSCYLLDPTAGGYTLEKTATAYLGAHLLPESHYTGEDAFSPLNPESMALSALAQHARAVGRLHETLGERIREEGMEKLLCEVELPLVPVLCQMEREGFLLDTGRLLCFGASLSSQIEELTQEIYRLAGEQFNINSTQQLGHILFEKLGLKVIKKTKKGYSTDIEVLEKLKNSHAIVPLIIEYRKLTKLKSTYVDGLSRLVGGDGRVHTTFQQMITATGRLSSTEPNLQNIPVRQQIGAEIRRCFVARPGWVLIDADYSQIELRVLAHIADDPIMKRAFLEGEDIHTVTASQVFGVPVEFVTPQMRSHAKAVNFGIVYGISAFSLSEDIHVSQKEAQGYIDSYLEKYSGVRRYMEEIKEKARQDGYVTTLWGRRRYLPELRSKNFNIRSFGERLALNTPIQGTAADIIKAAMVAVFRRLKKEGLQARLLLQVHDELIIEAPEEEAERVSALLKEEMEGAFPLSVRLVADVSQGENWYEAKK